MRLRSALLAASVLACLFSGTALGAATKVYDRVDAAGRIVGETVPAADGHTPMAAKAAFMPGGVRGAHAVAVIPIEFSAQPGTFAPAAIAQTIFTGTASVNAFVKESTYGRVWLTGRDSVDGDVYPAVTLTTPITACTEDTWGQQAIAALRAQGKNITGDGLDGYDHYVFLFSTKIASCGYAGLGMMPGRETWINGYLDRQVISHELGHNFGLAHANSLRCTDGAGTPVLISATCTSGEYEDPFESMGVAGKQFSAPARALLGILDGVESVKVTAPTTLVIETSSVPGTGTKSVEIARPGTSQSWFLEARSIGGQFDNFTSTDAVLQGVLIRRHDSATYFADPTELVDGHPATTTFLDAAVLPGETFIDPAGVRVTVTARSATTATVAIAFGAAPPPTTTGTTPTATSGTTATPTSTGTTPTGPVSGAIDPLSLRTTTDPAVAKRWPSRITVLRLAGGRVLVVTRIVTRAKACSYRVKALRERLGRCTRLTGANGWRVVSTVRAGTAVTVTAITPTRTLVRKRVRVPAAVGAFRAYRL